jgi:hypothetical protein
MRANSLCSNLAARASARLLVSANFSANEKQASKRTAAKIVTEYI